MSDIILSMRNGKPVVSSRQIAENFDKNHRDVLRAVDNLKEDVRNFAQMFFESTEADSYGREQRTYLMNRDGFTLLAMQDRRNRFCMTTSSGETKLPPRSTVRVRHGT